ncbi:hypothetical protein GCM10017581_038710 [Dactylosporangium matsuzakiense]|uniref:Uncharacterized protein n=1 Tax=Dactylosporangium matsuzakiense TaxID=53360 RepID=A0A9W6NM84_9ACTN|nr:hypothetical protein GCM10017581_038710 [Dactylosporangium matsuzakiense]
MTATLLDTATIIYAYNDPAATVPIRHAFAVLNAVPHRSWRDAWQSRPRTQLHAHQENGARLAVRSPQSGIRDSRLGRRLAQWNFIRSLATTMRNVCDAR